MDLKLISTYRTHLMGIAILWIMFFHSDIKFEPHSVFKLIHAAGNCGVDIFIFVSGLGLYFSLSKGTSLKLFYKNRVLRILPYYIPIVLLISVVMYIIGGWTLGVAVQNILMISYWFIPEFKYMFDWYIPSILLLYLLTPLFYSLFKKNRWIFSISLTLIAWGLTVFFAGTENFRFTLILARLPIYVVGFWVADAIIHNKSYLGKKQVAFSILVFLIGIGLFLYFYFTNIDRVHKGSKDNVFILENFNVMSMFVYSITIPPFCLLVSYLLSLFPKYTFPVIKFFGTYSLTHYIFHERVRNIFSFLKVETYSYLLIFIITVILAYTWAKTVDRVLKKLNW